MSNQVRPLLTSLYLTTQLALCKGKVDQKNVECNSGIFSANKDEWTKKPRLFEIGNDGPVDISHEHNEFLDAQTSGQSRIGDEDYILFKIRNFVMTAVMLFFLPLLLIVFFTPKKHHFDLIIVTAGAIFFIFYIYYLLEWYSGIELVSFTNGTSMWPSVIMKILAILLSAYFFVRIHTKLSDNQKNIKQNYLNLKKDAELEESLWKNFLKNRDELFLWLKESKKALVILFTCLSNQDSRNQLKKGFFIDDWKKTGSPKKNYFNDFWNEYLNLSKWRFAFLRVSLALVITVIICGAMLTFNDVSFHHIRGQSNDAWNLLSLCLAVLFYVSLILYIADKVHVSSHFIKWLANSKIEVDWPDDVKKTYQNKYGLPEEVIKNRILLDFINDHTSVPNKFIYYPFFCLFLIIMSRNYYFDNWPTTPFVLSVYAFFAFLTLISAIRLRAAALYARERILEKLVNNSRHAPVNAIWHKKNDNPAKLKSFIDEIREFKEGIYRPLAYHPMVLNLLVPFSSIGGIYLIEYLI